MTTMGDGNVDIDDADDYDANDSNDKIPFNFILNVFLETIIV